VIPNYFDLDEFEFNPGPREDHLLYVGRIILRKGIHVAAQAAERSGHKLLVAGQGVLDHEAGKFITSEEMTITSPNVEFIGTLDRERRSYEMGRARAVMVPTQYIEPFGGVAVEAQLCGTPVITTNWGAFTENVSHGVSGFRPDTMREFVQAIGLSSQLDPVRVREWAASRYSLESVAPQFEDWFDRLDTLWGSGYYEG
jgi:glycosyltransferase involved in cell wall biosynthesis